MFLYGVISCYDQRWYSEANRSAWKSTGNYRGGSVCRWHWADKRFSCLDQKSLLSKWWTVRRTCYGCPEVSKTFIFWRRKEHDNLYNWNLSWKRNHLERKKRRNSIKVEERKREDILTNGPSLSIGRARPKKASVRSVQWITWVRKVNGYMELLFQVFLRQEISMVLRCWLMRLNYGVESC